jgi:hypothetical protein
MSSRDRLSRALDELRAAREAFEAERGAALADPYATESLADAWRTVVSLDTIRRAERSAEEGAKPTLRESGADYLAEIIDAQQRRVLGLDDETD